MRFREVEGTLTYPPERVPCAHAAGASPLYPDVGALATTARRPTTCNW
jgi:hypothetical protein